MAEKMEVEKKTINLRLDEFVVKGILSVLEQVQMARKDSDLLYLPIKEQYQRQSSEK